jgi:uncharacterized protein YjbI with pentapeptide repeats
VPQSPPQTLLQRSFCHCEAMIGVDMVVIAVAGAATVGADTTGAATIDADVFGADVFGGDTTGADMTGADVFGAAISDSSRGSACAVLEASCRRSNTVLPNGVKVFGRSAQLMVMQEWSIRC